jgi:hypothetical protein
MIDQPPVDFIALLGAIGDSRFLEISPKRPANIHAKSFFGGHFVSLRSFWKIELNGDELSLTSMSSRWLESMINDNKVSIKHEKPDDGLLFLTASTPELQEFVKSYTNDEKAFPSTGDEQGILFSRTHENISE